MPTHPAPTRRVLLQARWAWVGFLVGCFVGLAVALPFVNQIQIHSKQWFIVPMLWLALAVPATLGLYGHCFRGEWARSSGAALPRLFMGHHLDLGGAHDRRGPFSGVVPAGGQRLAGHLAGRLDADAAGLDRAAFGARKRRGLSPISSSNFLRTGPGGRSSTGF